MIRLFITANRAGLSLEENSQRGTELARFLVENGFSFIVATGVYQEDGQSQALTELTYIVNAPGPMSAALFADMMHAVYQQECIGVLNGPNFYLQYPKVADCEYVGRWERRSERPMGNATFMGGQWYAANPELPEVIL